METQASTRQVHVPPPLRAALSWRYLLSWTVAMLIPAAIVTMPLWKVFADVYDFAARGDELAHKLNPLLMLDATVQVMAHAEWMAGAFTLATIAMLLLSPLCAGLAVASYPEPPPTLFGLLRGAVANYPRLFRLLIVSIIPFGIVAMIATVNFGIVDKTVEKSVLESTAVNTSRIAMTVTVLIFVLAQLTLELARAQMAANPALQSALRAWARGIKMLAARPGAVLGRYLVPTVVSLLVASILVLLRVRAGFVIGLLLTQLIVAAVGWGRAARIFALAGLAREIETARR